MPRRPRALEPNALSHVTSRGNRGEPIFTDSTDFARFLAILEQATTKFRWRCVAYCLMTNHYHLVLRTPEPNISQAMHHLNGCYARWFNRRHAYEGHLFQRRFRAAAIESDWHLLEACRYVVLNPVRAGLARRPSEWQWSSYRATVGTAPEGCTLALEEILGFFGRQRRAARAAFRAFVDDAIAASDRPYGPRPSAWHRGVAGLAEAVGAREALGEKADEEGGREADDVEVVAFDAVD